MARFAPTRFAVAAWLLMGPGMLGSGELLADQEFPNTQAASSGQPMGPAEAAASFDLPEDFEVRVFAAEPDVQNPIDASWDSRGRLWVAENYTYAERSQRFDLSLRDRVVILDGADGDRATQRTVFTDDVQMLTSIEVAPNGVYLMCPPTLLFIPDADQDDVPDGPAQVVLDGFTVAEANYHNFANGIRFGPDGWLYGRCGGSCPGRIGKPGTPDAARRALEGGMWRYHPQSEIVEVLTTGTTNPWGHDFDARGEGFFVNTVNGHLWHLIHGAHFTRPFTLDPNRRTFELIDFHADHWHFDTGGAWHESRDGAANAYGGGHAHCGTLIYEDPVWPDRYRGKLWTLNFHGRRVNQEILKRQGGGFVATHDEDLFIVGDPWFRGMNLLTGPDGNVFVLDWSDTGECHEHDGVHRTSGRIYKIKHCDAPERKTPDISTWKLADWMAASSSSRSWDRRIAIRHLHHSSLRQTLQSDPGYADAVADLRRALADTRDLGTASQTRRMRALMTLHAFGEVDTPVLLDCFQSACETVRTWAIRLSGERWPLDDAMGAAWKQHRETTPDAETLASMLPAWLDLARHDGSAQVRLNLASLLQRLPVENRVELASALVSHASDAADHNIPRLIWYGLIPLLDEAPEQLVDVLVKCRLPDTSRLISRGLGEWLDKHPDVVDRLLAAVADLPADCRDGAVDGFVQAMRGRRSATPPRSWPRLADAVGASDPRIRDLQALFGDGRAVEDLKRIVSGKTPSDDATRMAALETLIRSDVPGLRSICEKQLKNAKLNVIAASGLATIDDPEVGRLLVSRYRNFRAPQRPKLIAMLVRRAGFVGPLLDAIEAKKVPRTALSAYDVRQIHALGDAELSAQVTRVWGEVRRTSAEKTRRIEALKESLDSDRLAAANLGKGRTLFQQQCQSCHKLYGEGEKVGPDLTGAGRQNLDYLLSNIVAPSSVVDKDYRLTLLMMDDGRVISGLVLDQNATAVVVQTATEKLTLPAAEIERQKVTEKSPMPEGLLATMTDDQIADLIAYLQHPTQVEAVKLDD